MRMRVGTRISSAGNTREVEAAKRTNVQMIQNWLAMRVEDAAAEVFADGTIEHRIVNLPPAIQTRTGMAARVNTVWRKVGTA